MPHSFSISVRRILSRLLPAIVLLGALAILFVFVENRRGENAWQLYRVDAAQRGIRLDFAAFIPAPIPDGDNFAAIPFFNEAFENSAAATERFRLPDQGKLAAPFSGFAGQASVDLTEWRDQFIRSKLLAAPGASAAADVLLALEPYSAVLDALHEAGLRPGSRFPVPWEQGFSAPQPHLTLLQQAATLRFLRLAARLGKHESAAAYLEWREILRMYRAIEKEPNLLTGLVRITFASKLCGTLRQGLPIWDAAELNAIQADLAGLRILDDYRFAIESERALLNQHGDQLATTPIWQRRKLLFDFDTQPVFADPDPSWLDPWLLRGMPVGWFRRNQIAANRCIDAILARVDVAAQRLDLSEPSPASVEWLLDHNPRRFCFSFFKSVEVYESVEKFHVAAWTAVQLGRTAIALEQFRRAHEGRYPETLAALVPDYLPAPPRELFADLPFCYRATPEDGAFLLYSRAMNQKDDEGKCEPKKRVIQQSDWAWSPARP